MKAYHVIIEPEAQQRIHTHLSYIRDKLKNPQAAKSVFEDFKASAQKLSVTADTIREPDDEELRSRGLKRRNFDRHEYFMLFKTDEDSVRVVTVFHFRENYIAKLK